MNRKLISKALSNIDSAYIEESLTVPEEVRHTPERTSKMGKYENRNGGNHSRRLLALVLAACLIFALAVTARSRRTIHPARNRSCGSRRGLELFHYGILERQFHCHGNGHHPWR